MEEMIDKEPMAEENMAGKTGENEPMTEEELKECEAHANKVARVYGMVGAALIAGMACLVLWSEYKQKSVDSLIDYARHNIIEVTDLSKVDPTLDGKLIHAVGVTAPTKPIHDDILGIDIDAVKWQRIPQYCVKTEARRSQDDAEQNDSVQDSGCEWADTHDNKDCNQPLLEVKRLDEQVKGIKMGAYTVDNRLYSRLKLEQYKFKLTNQQRDNIAEMLDFRGDRWSELSDYTENGSILGDLPEHERRLSYVHVSPGRLYLGRSTRNDELGDVIIDFSYFPTGETSVVAQVKGDRLVVFEKNGASLSALRPGNVPAEEMISSEHKTDSSKVWVIRLVALVLTICGYRAVYGYVEGKDKKQSVVWKLCSKIGVWGGCALLGIATVGVVLLFTIFL